MWRAFTGSAYTRQASGEPFKAFAYPIDDFYKSRYVKIAMTMEHIDQLAAAIIATFANLRMFAGISDLISEFATAARSKCETLRTDPDIFEIWTSFAVSGETLCNFHPKLFAVVGPTEQHWAMEGMKLVREGRKLIEDMTRARVPMPKSAREYIERLETYRAQCVDLLSKERSVA